MTADNSSPVAVVPARRRPSRWVFIAFGLVVAAYLASQLGWRPSAEPMPGPNEGRLIAEVKRLGGQMMAIGATPGVFGFGSRPIYTISLDNTPIDDAGLARLAPWMGGRVQSLTLRNTQVTDAGLAHLAGLSRLVILDAGNFRDPPALPGERRHTEIRGPGLARLAALPALKTLDLRGSEVDDAGLAHLKGVRLFNLNLGGAKVKGPGLAHLKGQPLVVLTLDFNGLDPDALQHLTGLNELQYLSLVRVGEVTPEALAPLARFPKLREVRLVGSGLLPADLIEVRKAMPGVKFTLQ